MVQDVWKNKKLLTFTPRAIIDARSIRRMKAPLEEFGHIQNARAAKALADAGVRVNLGAHGQLQGLGVHWELWMLAQGGMTPMEALRCATVNGAYYLGLENIQNSVSITWVVKNGRVYNRWKTFKIP